VTPTYIIHISFYEQGSERHIASVDHACPPRVGDKVWLGWRDDDGAYRTGCFLVESVAWSYTSPTSPAGLDGEMGGMVDVMVSPTVGLFQ